MPARGDDAQLRVLVIEDDPDIAKLLEFELTDRGCVVERVSSRFSALLTADLDRYDVATVDLMLGGEAAGVTILGVLIERWPRIRRVIVSAIADRDDTLDALAHAVVLKPWAEEELWKAVSP